MKFGFKVRRAACIVLAATAISAVNSFAVTSQFRGVNWAGYSYFGSEFFRCHKSVPRCELGR